MMTRKTHFIVAIIQRSLPCFQRSPKLASSTRLKAGPLCSLNETAGRVFLSVINNFLITGILLYVNLSNGSQLCPKTSSPFVLIDDRWYFKSCSTWQSSPGNVRCTSNFGGQLSVIQTKHVYDATRSAQGIWTCVNRQSPISLIFCLKSY